MHSATQTKHQTRSTCNHQGYLLHCPLAEQCGQLIQYLGGIHRQANANACSLWELVRLLAVGTGKGACRPHAYSFINTQKAPAKHLHCWLGRCSKLQQHLSIHRQANATACSLWELVHPNKARDTLWGPHAYCRSPHRGQGTSKAPAVFVNLLQQKLQQHPGIHRQANANVCSLWELLSLHVVRTVEGACCLHTYSCSKQT